MHTLSEKQLSGRVAKISSTLMLAVCAVTSEVAASQVQQQKVQQPEVQQQANVTANAQVEVNIPRQPLHSALIQLAIQSGQSIIAPSEIMAGKLSPSLRGSYPLSRALELLLKQSGLDFQFSPNGRSVLVVAASPAKTVTPPEEQQTAGRGFILEELVTVGSRIPRGHILRLSDSMAPVVSIDFNTIGAAGTTSFTDVIRNLTSNNGSPIINEQNSLAGALQFNLRGVGIASTLTLINGRRSGKSGLSDTGGNFFFDIGHIPLNMIERIDVQQDGASAIYGSEAVGGVINIVTRKGFNGLELSGNHTNASNQTSTLSFTSGSWGDRGGYNIYANYFRQGRNDRTDFDWLTERLGHTGDLENSVFFSAAGAPGTYRQAQVDPVSGLIREINADLPFADPDCETAGGLLRNSNCLHSFLGQNSVLHEKRYLQLFSEATWKISDSTTFFSEVGFNDGRINRTRGPGNFNNGLIAGSGRIFIPASHPFNFFVEGDTPGELEYIGPELWDNELHTAIDLSCQCRVLGAEFNSPNEIADRVTHNDFVRALAGIESQLSEELTLSISYLRSTARWDLSTPFNYSAPVVNDLILSGQFNPFGTRIANPELLSPKDGISIAGLSEEILAVLQERDFESARQDQQVLDAVFTGSLTSLPAGDIGFALGTQMRRETFQFINDPKLVAGTGGLRGTLNDVDGTQRSWAYFAELLIPLSDSFDMQLALRHEDYNLEAANNTDPKISLRWQQSDSLALRGSYSSSFQAPSLRQITEARSASIISDPASLNSQTGELECGGSSSDGNTSTLIRGNTDLNSQQAKNLTLGIVITPSDNTSLIADYWKIDYRDLIVPDQEAAEIVSNDCRDDGIPNDPRVIRSAGGNILTVTSDFINSGELLASGMDLSINHTQAVGNGDIGFNLTASYVERFRFDPQDGGPVIEGAGSRNALNQFNSIPQWRANANLSWRSERFYSSATIRYISSYRNDQNSNLAIDSHTTLDLLAGVTLNNDWGESEVVFAINNITDQDPPSLGVGQRPGYDPTVHDIRGRQMVLAFKHRFF